MLQQINFINVLPKKKQSFDFNKMILVIGGELALFLISVIWMITVLLVQNWQLQGAEQERLKASQKLQEIARNHPLLSTEASLDEKIAHLKSQYQTHEDYYEALTHRSLRQGFSAYLTLFAQTIPEEVWLSKILIDQVKVHYQIQGWVTSPASLSIFMQTLNKSKLFSQENLDLFDLQRQENKMQFELSNDVLSRNQKEKAELKTNKF